MSFTINPRVLSVLSLAVVSVASQWTGAYNATAVTDRDGPAPECIIKSFATDTITSVLPCTCTGGNVTADCNWNYEGKTYSTVRDAECKCATTGVLVLETDSLKAYTKSKPNAVNGCVCDPAEPGKGEPDADGLVVAAGDCWCLSERLKANSGLKEAEEQKSDTEVDKSEPVKAQKPDTEVDSSEPVKPSFCTQKPAAPVDAAAAPLDAAAVRKCSTELDNSRITKTSLCDQLKEDEDTEMTERMKAILPSCTVAALTEICKSS
ncbi:uncharacterized protein BBA_04763 [Beauveria bassiana ARSEF 2860]|uniref:Uncharacterized protein n=1 Tax=Beauveria bassiana (strain ARSEF 2860) TaxID=655819 RepID=J4W7Q3_BEAB2|nr:uncharacterized protein BBA_04763 [Beauveria bassiana ARSEF 2860]EJP66270.1 hypothetical protein BBA_04763 [Beauveria bassiana ARSEF 2860]